MNSYPFLAQTPGIQVPQVPVIQVAETPALLTPDDERARKLIQATGGRAPDESYGSLKANADKQRNILDSFIEGGDALAGVFGQKVGINNIDWSQREFTPDGRVKVTWQDAISGRSQPELQLAYENARREALIRTEQDNFEAAFPGNRLADRFKTDYSEKGGQQLNASNLSQTISKQNQRVERAKPLLLKLSKMQGGAQARQELLRATKNNPTAEQVSEAIAKLQPKQPSEIRAADLHRDSIETGKGNRALQQEQIQTLRSQAADASRQTDLAFDQLKLAEWQANATNIYNQNALTVQQYNANEDRRLREAQQAQTMQLAIMGQEDRAADRRFNREDRREDRQMMMQQMRIKMLIESLNSLGRAFQL